MGVRLVEIKGWRYCTDTGVHEESADCDDRPDGKPPCDRVYRTELVADDWRQEIIGPRVP